jgi:release factor glutamine methyltransferase
VTPRAVLPAAIARLKAAGVPDPARDARLLLAHAAGVPPERLTLHLDDPLAEPAVARLDAALVARAARQPVSQIVGERLFWGRAFRVTPDVLDPRPETEILVAAALEERFDRVLDLGTGSGAILLTLLAERPEAMGLGVDRSPAALNVAEANARALGVSGRCELRISDWLAQVTERFDLIVANPPYLATAEMAALAPETRDWEPAVALAGGADGLDAYRTIAAQAGAHLVPGGRLLLEIGPTQRAAVSALLARAGFADIGLRRDFDGRDRVILARSPGER